LLARFRQREAQRIAGEGEAVGPGWHSRRSSPRVRIPPDGDAGREIDRRVRRVSLLQARGVTRRGGGSGADPEVLPKVQVGPQIHLPPTSVGAVCP